MEPFLLFRSTRVDDGAAIRELARHTYDGHDTLGREFDALLSDEACDPIGVEASVVLIRSDADDADDAATTVSLRRAENLVLKPGEVEVGRRRQVIAFENLRLIDAGRTGWIESLRVHPAFRGLGLSLRLQREQIRRAVAAASSRLERFRYSTVDANAASRHIGQRCGFAVSELTAFALIAGDDLDRARSAVAAALDGYDEEEEEAVVVAAAERGGEVVAAALVEYCSLRRRESIDVVLNFKVFAADAIASLLPELHAEEQTWTLLRVAGQRADNGAAGVGATERSAAALSVSCARAEGDPAMGRAATLLLRPVAAAVTAEDRVAADAVREREALALLARELDACAPQSTLFLFMPLGVRALLEARGIVAAELGSTMPTQARTISLLECDLAAARANLQLWSKEEEAGAEEEEGNSC